MTSPAVPLEHAEEQFVQVEASPKIELWLRKWGNRASGIPVLFVHGGPGNNIVATYSKINKGFFDCNLFFVVEIDQRGCGKSRPGVLDPVNGVANMQLYRDISLPQMSADFETVRKELGIDKWLVFGGSWGSTLALDYAIRYSERCLGLIVRGIWLGTPAEHDEVYARKAFAGHDTAVKRFQLKQFETFFQYAHKEVERQRTEESSDVASLDPDDSERICRVYESLVGKGDRKAAWLCYAYEENLMSEESDLLNYDQIDEEAYYSEAQSVAFFEMRLFLRLTFEDPPNIIARLGALRNVKTWVVQGTGDAVCPDTYARHLVAGLEKEQVSCKSYFVDAGHKSSSKNIKKSLQQSVLEFAEEVAGIMSMKVTANKSAAFYAKSAKSLLLGGMGKDGIEKKAMSQLQISGLGNSINIAVAAAQAVEQEGIARIIRIDTSYPEADGSKKPCARISVLLAKA